MSSTHWELKISHDGLINIMKIRKHYKRDGEDANNAD